MFKSKKKMSKQSLVIVIMSILMVGMLAFGGTYAYFTASTKTTSDSVTTGHVKLTANAQLVLTTDTILPGDTIFNGTASYTLTSDVTGTAGAYIAVKIKFETTSDVALDIIWADLTGMQWVESSVSGIYILSTSDSSKGSITPYALAPAAADETVSVNIFTNITFGSTTEAEDNYTEGNSESDSDNKLMDKSVTVTITARSIQAKNITSTNVEGYLTDDSFWA